MERHPQPTLRTAARGHSLEFFPPKTDKGRERLLATVGRLAALGPSFVSVTFGAGGSTRDRSYDTTTAILRTTNLHVTPHMSCIGSTRDQIRDMLSTYETVGVRRIVALRGDIPNSQGAPPQDFRYANELVAYIKQAFPSFHLSVACYPEFHPEAPDAETDMQNFARKVAAGADEAISQYFYNNDAYYRFVDDVARLGVSIPIVPGLMPITEFDQVVRFSSFCGAEIPLWIRRRMERFAGDLSAQKELGIEIATRQAEDLLRNGAPGLHFYTLNRAEPTERVWQNLGLAQASPRRPLSPTATN